MSSVSAGLRRRIESRRAGVAACRRGHPKTHSRAPRARLHAVARDGREEGLRRRLDDDLAATGADRAGLHRRPAERRLVVIGVGAPDGAFLRPPPPSSRRSASARLPESFRNRRGRHRASCLQIERPRLAERPRRPRDDHTEAIALAPGTRLDAVPRHRRKERARCVGSTTIWPPCAPIAPACSAARHSDD